MKTLILPDVHTYHEIAQKVIDNVKADKVVLVGDMFDQFYDSVDSNVATAKWVKSNLDKWTFLLGNHDYVYRYDKVTKCSGWTPEKHKAINSILTQEDWSKFKLFEIVEGWLLTHAGLTLDLVHPKVKDVIKWLGIECNAALKDPAYHWLFAAGRDRGGSREFGGITWCDANVFSPIPEIKQCFGHTPLRRVMYINEDNICIDTNLKNYAIIENGKLTVHDV